jgi:hypothetical protein
VLLMLIMVGIRAAVTKDDNKADLHYAAAPHINTPDFGIMLNGSSFDENAGPWAWDPKILSEFFFIGSTSDHTGLVGGANTIQFVPGNDPTVQQIAADFKATYPLLANFTQTRFASDDDLNAYVRSEDYATSGANAAIAAAVVITKTGSAWDVQIRGNTSQTSPDRASTLSTDGGTVSRLQTKYNWQPPFVLLARGHHLLQDHVSNWIIRNEAGAKLTSLSRDYSFVPFPTPPYIDDPFADTIANVLGLFFTIIYMWPVTRLIKGIVEEKQLRIKEGMRMMGLPDSALYCSWFGTYTLIFFLTSILITIVTAGSVYAHSNKFYIFIFFFFFAMSTFSFCWLVSVFFSRSTVGTTMGALIFLISFFP